MSETPELDRMNRRMRLVNSQANEEMIKLANFLASSFFQEDVLNKCSYLLDDDQKKSIQQRFRMHEISTWPDDSVTKKEYAHAKDLQEALQMLQNSTIEAASVSHRTSQIIKGGISQEHHDLTDNKKHLGPFTSTRLLTLNESEKLQLGGRPLRILFILYNSWNTNPLISTMINENKIGKDPLIMLNSGIENCGHYFTVNPKNFNIQLEDSIFSKTRRLSFQRHQQP